MGDVFRLLLLYLNGFTERLGALKAPQKKKKNAFSATQVSVFWGKWLHRFNQARLNSRDGPSGVSFYRCFHLHFPSPAASACFPSEISPMWQLMCHWDPADSCQQPHLEANGRDGKQRASFPADKTQTWIVIIIILSSVSEIGPNYSTTFPRGLSMDEPRACKSVCLYTSHQEQILMLNFLAVGHPIMHLSSANSNVTLTLGRGVSWNVMNNLIKLHSRSKRGIIRLVLWVLAALKGPARLRHPARHHAWN